MADCTPGKVVSLDFGSTHVAPAVFGAEGPEEIEMGKTKIDFGDEIPCSLYPTTLIFPEKPPKEVPKNIPDEGTGIELAGYRPLTDRPVAYGIKQSLDLDLCKTGSQGALIRIHFASHGPVEEVLDDSLTKIFRRIWQQVDKHRQKKGYGRPEEVWLTVPAKYARGLEGKKIQERLARCAIRGGFPSVAIGLKSEMEAVFYYLDYLEREMRSSNESGKAETQWPIRREIMVNVGGGVVDVSAVERLKGAMQLLCTSDSRPGGISDVLTTLQAMCKILPSGSFRLLEQHVHILDEECRDIQIDRYTFEGKVLKMMILDAYDEGFRLAETFIRKIPQVTKVYIFGRPPASNKLIKAVCLERFSRLRNKMREEGLQADFEIEVLGPDIAGKGVHLGACIPFVDNPASRFHKLCFGFLISEEKRGKGKRKRKNSGRSIVRFQEVKAPYSDELETYWEALEADEADPNTLTIEPHTIHADDWKPLVSMKSAETHRPVGPTTYAVPMEPIKVDLKGRAASGQTIWVRFKRKDQELHPTLYKLQVDCRERDWFSPDPDEGECIEIDLELRCDAERLLFALRDGEPGDDEDDEENEGELRSGKSTRREIADSDSEREAKRRKSRVIVGPRDGTEAAHEMQTRCSESTNRKNSRKQKEGPYNNSPHLASPRRAELLENSRDMNPGFREDSARHAQGTSTQPDLTSPVAQKDSDANHGTEEASQEANEKASKAVKEKPQGKEPETNSRTASPKPESMDTEISSEVLRSPQQANILQSDSVGEGALGQAEERTGRAKMAQQNPPTEQNTAPIGQQTPPMSPPRTVHNKAELRTLPADQGTDESLTERDNGSGARVAVSKQTSEGEPSQQAPRQEDLAGSLEIRQSKGREACGQANHALDISSSPDEGEPNAKRPAHNLRYSQPNEETSLQATARARESLPDRQRKRGAVDLPSNVLLRRFKGARGVNLQESDRLAPRLGQRPGLSYSIDNLLPAPQLGQWRGLSHSIDNTPPTSMSASSSELGSNVSKAATLSRRLSLPSFKDMFG